MSELDEDEQPEAGNETSMTSTRKLVAVSESTNATLEKCFTQSLKNTERLTIRDAYGLPKVICTKTPQLEHFLREEVSQATKTADNELARVHTFLLDAVAPLTALLDKKVTGSDNLDPNVLNAVQAACQLVGNASTKLASLRREKIMTSLNRSLLPLVKEEELFKKAAPGLFGTEFAGKCKTHVEQVKAMRSSLKKDTGAERKPFFRGGPLNRRGGGQHYNSRHYSNNQHGGRYSAGNQRGGYQKRQYRQNGPSQNTTK